jgi:hypothetical protein
MNWKSVMVAVAALVCFLAPLHAEEPRPYPVNTPGFKWVYVCTIANQVCSGIIFGNTLQEKVSSFTLYLVELSVGAQKFPMFFWESETPGNQPVKMRGSSVSWALNGNPGTVPTAPSAGVSLVGFELQRFEKLP